MRDGGNHFLRIVGVAFGIAAVVGSTIGQGILRSPGLVASGVSAPWLILTLWIAGGVLIAIDAMSTVELVTSIQRSGGPYSFVTRTFGRFTGLLAGVSDFLGIAGAIAFVSVVFGEYLHRLGIAGGVPIAVLAVSVIAVFCCVQLIGTRIGARSQELGSAIKALIYFALVVALMLAPRSAPVVETLPAPLTLAGLIVAIRSIVGTYLGWNGGSYYAEEVIDPARAIPRSTFVGIALVTTIYVAVNVALLNVLTPQQMAGSTLVAADAAAHVFGPRADAVVTGISLISLVTLLNLYLMGLPRVVFAIARDAGIPHLARLSADSTPRVAIMTVAITGALLASIGVYTILLAFSTWLMTAVAATVNLAAIVLRRREPDLARPWRMPLFPLPAIFSGLVNLTILAAFGFSSPDIAWKATLLAVVLASAIYVATRSTHLTRAERMDTGEPMAPAAGRTTA